MNQDMKLKLWKLRCDVKETKNTAVFFAKRGFGKVFDFGASGVRNLAVGTAFVVLPSAMVPSLLTKTQTSDVRVEGIGDRQLKALEVRLDEMRHDAATSDAANNAAYLLSQERVINPKDETLIPREKAAVTRATEWANAVTTNNNDFEYRIVMARAISERDASRLVDDYRQINKDGFRYAAEGKFYPIKLNNLDECQDQHLKGSEGSAPTGQCMIDKSYAERNDALTYQGGAAAGMLTLFFIASSLGRKFNNQTRAEASWRREDKIRKAQRKREDAAAKQRDAANKSDKSIDMKIEIKRTPR